MDFKDLVQVRRSHRKFTTEALDEEAVKLILRAALMSPTSKSTRAWQFVVTEDKALLEKLADAKDMGGQFVKDCTMAIAVCGNPLMDDCWIEDGSIAAYSMMLQAEDLGIGSCWVQMRGRGLSDGTSAETVVRGIFDLSEDLKVLCVVAFGKKAMDRKLQDEEKLKWENVTIV